MCTAEAKRCSFIRAITGLKKTFRRNFVFAIVVKGLCQWTKKICQKKVFYSAKGSLYSFEKDTVKDQKVKNEQMTLSLAIRRYQRFIANTIMYTSLSGM